MPAVDSRQLTYKQAEFVREYLVDLDAGKAAARAGYSAKSAKDLGPALLKNPRVRRAIDERMVSRAERTNITSDKVLQELALIGFSDIRHYTLDAHYNVTLAEGAPEAAMRAISSVEHDVTQMGEDGMILRHKIKYRLWDKNTALTNLAKHLNLLTVNVNVSGTVTHEHTYADRLNLAKERALARRRELGLRVVS